MLTLQCFFWFFVGKLLGNVGELRRWKNANPITLWACPDSEMQTLPHFWTTNKSEKMRNNKFLGFTRFCWHCNAFFFIFQEKLTLQFSFSIFRGIIDSLLFLCFFVCCFLTLQWICLCFQKNCWRYCVFRKSTKIEKSKKRVIFRNQLKDFQYSFLNCHEKICDIIFWILFFAGRGVYSNFSQGLMFNTHFTNCTKRFAT